jgi:hypothetical protein
MKNVELLLPYHIPNGDGDIGIFHNRNFDASSALIMFFVNQSFDFIKGLKGCKMPLSPMLFGMVCNSFERLSQCTFSCNEISRFVYLCV